ncbi:MAG TPA: CaiB/BaiF CoA-transferase family protein [Deltaproteobacteria bacterium]|nr:CaiB/BaiF CoA-transferase family protein [Deltaproteobacteria bacterium]HQI01468.1 CaiB/BaiF CoA-transferase family protein [Deltaproteobacteria bacterium]
MPGPLNGLKILDFTTLLPGPFASMNLSDLGAEVLRVTSGSRPDLAAAAPPFFPGTDLSFAVAYLGRGKRSITLNLKDKRAVRIVHQLIETYDILIEQFRPGVMAKFGLDYENLREINPALIYCSITGYGQDSPIRGRAGHDINYLARSGVMSYSGKDIAGPPLMGMQIADVASGSNNAMIGILAAVVSRTGTGRGQHVDISMTDGVIAFNALVAGGYLVDGLEPRREGFLINGGSLYDFYETKNGGYLCFGGLEPQFFTAFCEAIGRPDLIKGGVVPENLEEVKSEIRACMKSKTRDEWMEIFGEIDACVDPVLSLSEALKDPHTEKREMVVEVDLGGNGKVRQLANPIKFSETKQEYRSAGVRAGTHTGDVLRELGYTDEEIAVFEREGLFR